MIKLVISHTAISKSICGNLNNLLKNLGIRMLESRRDDDPVPPSVDVDEPWRGRDMVGFMMLRVYRVCVEK